MKKIKTVDTILCYKVSAWIASDYKFIVMFRKSFVYFSMYTALPLEAFINLIFEQKMVWNKQNMFSIWKFCEFDFFCAFKCIQSRRNLRKKKNGSFENRDENQFPNLSPKNGSIGETQISTQTWVWPSLNLKILTKVLK